MDNSDGHYCVYGWMVTSEHNNNNNNKEQIIRVVCRSKLFCQTWIRDLKNWIRIRPKRVEVTNIMTSRFFFFVESVLFLFKLLKLFQAALNKFNIRSDRDLSFLPDPDLNSLFQILIIGTTTIILYSKKTL